MVDSKKVIENIERLLSDSIPCNDCPIYEIMDDALALLKEQEPVEPDFLHGDWICPKCSGIVCRYVAQPSGYIEKILAKYCPQCGQPVKWD